MSNETMVELRKQIIGTSDFSVYTVKELQKMATCLEIVGRWDMKKAQLISAIEEYKLLNKSSLRQQSTEERDRKAKVGMIIAFRRESGKLTTGKIITINDDTFDVEDVYRNMCNIPKHRVMWYKTTPKSRFPRFIYNELKGIK